MPISGVSTRRVAQLVNQLVAGESGGAKNRVEIKEVPMGADVAHKEFSLRECTTSPQFPAYMRSVALA